VNVIRERFNHGRFNSFLCLCGIVLISILMLPCFGMGIGYSEPVFSVTSTNEPIHQVLEKISKATGYQITITKGWEQKSITADINNLTLEEGMKKIIRSMGEPSNAIVRNDREKKIEIRIFDGSSGYSSGKTALPTETEREQETAQRPLMEREGEIKRQFMGREELKQYMGTEDNMQKDRKRKSKQRPHN